MGRGRGLRWRRPDSSGFLGRGAPWEEIDPAAARRGGSRARSGAPANAAFFLELPVDLIRGLSGHQRAERGCQCLRSQSGRLLFEAPIRDGPAGGLADARARRSGGARGAWRAPACRAPAARSCMQATDGPDACAEQRVCGLEGEMHAPLRLPVHSNHYVLQLSVA